MWKTAATCRVSAGLHWQRTHSFLVWAWAGDLRPPHRSAPPVGPNAKDSHRYRLIRGLRQMRWLEDK